MKRFLLAALLVCVASSAYAASFVFGPITISDQYLDNAGGTQRAIIKVQSTGGTGGVIALTDVLFTLPGGGTIGQQLGDIAGDFTEDQDVNSWSDHLNANANAQAYVGNLDSHTLNGFSAVLGATSPNASQWFLSTCGQDALPPDFTKGVAAAVNVIQIVIPDGLALGAGLNVHGFVQTAATSGGATTKSFFDIPEPVTMSLLALGGLALLRRRS